ncbi:hypothetical protein F4802DRAFT_256683 [Xylaria palmicola]|nr:hypothetical protein F4802DRAFT_256683 [Xylaria palmicola]
MTCAYWPSGPRFQISKTRRTPDRPPDDRPVETHTTRQPTMAARTNYCNGSLLRRDVPTYYCHGLTCWSLLRYSICLLLVARCWPKDTSTCGACLYQTASSGEDKTTTSTGAGAGSDTMAPPRYPRLALVIRHQTRTHPCSPDVSSDGCDPPMGAFTLETGNEGGQAHTERSPHSLSLLGICACWPSDNRRRSWLTTTAAAHCYPPHVKFSHAGVYLAPVCRAETSRPICLAVRVRNPHVQVDWSQELIHDAPCIHTLNLTI